jgi:hypothetical protein
MRGRERLRLWRLSSSAARTLGDQSELKNPSRAEREHDHRPEDHREQERNGEGQAAPEDDEVHLHGLQVLEDEDKDHHKRENADDQRRPGAAESGLPLARVGSG